MAKVTLEGWKCERCGHEWVPREPDKIPLVCSRCKSPYWNKPRKKAKPEGKSVQRKKGKDPE